jgi:hypothetical protein
MRFQNAHRLDPMKLPQTRYAFGTENRHIAFDRGFGDARQLPGSDLGFALADQPKDLEALLDPWVGMPVPLDRQSVEILLGKGESALLGHPWLLALVWMED